MTRSGPGSPRASFAAVAIVLGMIALPACLTLTRVRVSAIIDVASPNPSPYGYTVSLLLFIVPIAAIGGWLVPRDAVRISKRSFLWTVALLFSLGVILDFFFAHLFLTFPNSNATLGIPAPALYGAGHIFVGSPGHIIIGSVPIEEYVFYFTGFVAVLLLYIWLDEYWVMAYTVPAESNARIDFDRLLRFHPESLILAVLLSVSAILYRHHMAGSGFPGYFVFLVVAALGPSSALFPTALPVINWRAFSMTLFIILLTSLLWEATLGIPYGWWGYRPQQMIGLTITAWNHLPIEAVCVWIAVVYQTAIVYEIIKRWQASGRKARHAFFGR
jgi:hypothetical protein